MEIYERLLLLEAEGRPIRVAQVIPGVWLIRAAWGTPGV